MTGENNKKRLLNSFEPTMNRINGKKRNKIKWKYLLVLFICLIARRIINDPFEWILNA